MRIVVISMGNIGLIGYFAFRTFISVNMLLFLIVGSIALGYAMSYSSKEKFQKAMATIGLGPGILSLFFLVNALFSADPTNETYKFAHKEEWYAGRHTNARLEKVAFIYLENNKYEAFPCIRWFIDFERMEDANRITYTIEDGLFGIRVVKSFEFQ